MKIPFLSGKIKSEFDVFLAELEQSVKTNVADARAASRHEIFSELYPVFVLLRCLSNSEYVRDLSRDTVLTELKRVGDKKKFMEAVLFFNKSHPYQKELKDGLQLQVFTGFFEELFSDTLLLLNSFYTCNYRGAHIALRCMLEDLYRHFYYRDHPQELWATGTTGKLSEYAIGLRPKSLREYLTRTSYLSGFSDLNLELEAKKGPDEQSLFDLNESLYSQCSGAVHGSAVIEHNKFKSNLDLTFSPRRSEEVFKATKQFSYLAVVFLTAAHVDQFIAATEYERSLVLSKLGDKRRGSLRKYLNV